MIILIKVTPEFYFTIILTILRQSNVILKVLLKL